MKMKQRRISVMLISLFCLLTLAGCSGQREIVSDATPVPSVTPEVVQAPIPHSYDPKRKGSRCSCRTT